MTVTEESPNAPSNSHAGCDLRAPQRSPVIFKVVTVLLGAYALLPSIGAPPVAIEGFEAAVTTAVNQPFFAPSAYDFPPYLYSSRPGEYKLYELTTGLLGGDALLHGQFWSVIFYLAGLFGVVLMTTCAGFGRAWVAALAYFLLFDVAANAAQASSSNLAAGLLALGGGLFCLANPFAKAAAVVACAGAVFCRLDALVLVPFALLVSALVPGSSRLSLVRAIVASVAAALLAVMLSHLAGLSVLQTVRENKGPPIALSLYAIKNLILTLVPWTIVPPLLGLTVGQHRVWRADPLRAALRAAVVLGPVCVLATLYLSKMETPRFLASASPFLALGTAMLIEWFLRAGTRVRIVAVVALGAMILSAWVVRRPAMVNDGFRYGGATYLTPYERFREKRFLANTGPRVLDDLANSRCAPMTQPRVTILVTGWRTFNEVLRQMVLAGARLKSVDEELLDVGAPGARYLFGMKNREIAVQTLDAEYPSVTASDLRAALTRLRNRGPVIVVGHRKAVTDDLLRATPSGSASFAAPYDRYERASTFSACFPAAGGSMPPGLGDPTSPASASNG